MSVSAQPNHDVPLSAELLKILRCPATGSALRQEGAELAAVDEAGAELGPRYPIRGGVPHVLPG